MIALDDHLQSAWQGKDIFALLAEMPGQEFRNKDGRRTFRCHIDGRPYFVKYHGGVGWRRIIKELGRLRLPVISAANEWRAIRRLEELGIATMRLAGRGQQGINPARRRSFVITAELENTCSLEDYCASWRQAAPPPALKRALITEVARVARTLHDNGINHRDFYLCHFLLDMSRSIVEMTARGPRLYLIDLHRVQSRRKLPRRWRIKDIAGLYFSSLGIGLTRRDCLRFMQQYRDTPLRRTLAEDRVFWSTVRKKGRAGYREFARKVPHAADPLVLEEIERAES